MTLDDTSDHRKEAAKSHNFANEEEAKAWFRNIEAFGDPGYSGTGQIADFFRLVEGRRGQIMKFLYEIMGAEDVEMLLDFLAYCLWREYKFNFWLLLHGAGFNGKSILLNLIEAFLGKMNVSGETLDRLLHERFAVAQLYNKMANGDADISADVVFDNTGVLEADW